MTREEHEAVVARMQAADRRASQLKTDVGTVTEEIRAARVEVAVRREAAKRK